MKRPRASKRGKFTLSRKRWECDHGEAEIEGGLNYYRHFIGDYLRKTVHLTMILDGAYRRLMDEYYVSEKPLTLDRTLLYARVRAHTPEECCAVDSVLKEFFVETRRGFTNKKADEEIEYASSRANIARNNGLAGGRPKTQRVPSGLAKTATPSKAPQTLDSRLQTPEKEREEKTPAAKPAAFVFAIPAWLPTEPWESYLKLRKAKRAKVTAESQELLIAKLDGWRMLGQDPGAILERSVMNGWTGIFEIPKENGNGKERQGKPTLGDNIDSVIETMQRSAGRPFGTYRETKTN